MLWIIMKQVCQNDCNSVVLISKNTIYGHTFFDKLLLVRGIQSCLHTLLLGLLEAFTRTFDWVRLWYGPFQGLAM